MSVIRNGAEGRAEINRRQWTYVDRWKEIERPANASELTDELENNKMNGEFRYSDPTRRKLIYSCQQTGWRWYEGILPEGK